MVTVQWNLMEVTPIHIFPFLLAAIMSYFYFSLLCSVTGHLPCGFRFQSSISDLQLMKPHLPIILLKSSHFSRKGRAYYKKNRRYYWATVEFTGTRRCWFPRSLETKGLLDLIPISNLFQKFLNSLAALKLTELHVCLSPRPLIVPFLRNWSHQAKLPVNSMLFIITVEAIVNELLSILPSDSKQ